MKLRNKEGERPPYLFGLLCILPLVGALVGIFMIFYGIFRYKDKLFVIIGCFGVALTITLYTLLFYNLKYGKSIAKGFAKISQTDLNKLAGEIEFYKIQTGQYPDSLQQLTKYNPLVVITDPLLTRKMDRSINILFQYQKNGEEYTLFSVGIDGIPHTTDDIYPDTTGFNARHIKCGFVKRQPEIP